MALINEYFELTQKYKTDYGENTILLMQVGSFFEVYGIQDKEFEFMSGSKIVDFSRICELSLVEKSKVFIKGDKVMMSGFKDMQLDKYIKKLQDAEYTVVVYTQDQATKNTTRSLCGIFSPGTYYPIESPKLTNNLTCIWIEFVENKYINKGKYVVVGISNIDIYTGKTSIFQFQEIYINNPTTYDELERFISIYNPSEVIIISNLPNKEINEVIQYVNIKCNMIHKIEMHGYTIDGRFYNQAKNCEKQNYQREILSRFYKNCDYDVFIQNFYENNIATQSFCFLLDFVYQHNPQLLNKIDEPIFENCSERLILANHSLKQLNIIDDSNYTGKYSSVLKMLNECFTAMGKRKFAHLFLNPITNIESLENEYNIIEYYLQNPTKFEFLKYSLSNITDLSKWERQIYIKKIKPKSIYYLYNSIQIVKSIYDKISKDAVLIQYISTHNQITGVFCEDILNFIDETVDLNKIKETDNYDPFDINFIKYGVNDELDKKIDLFNISVSKLESICDYFNCFIEENESKKRKNTKKITEEEDSKKFVKIHETEKNNYTLISTEKRCHLLKQILPQSETIISLVCKYNNESFPFYVSQNKFKYEKQSLSNFKIKDEQINALCDVINKLKMELKQYITMAYNKFIDEFESLKEKLESIIQFITCIDVSFTKSIISQKFNLCKPTIVPSEKSFVNAKKMRHCLIEQIQTNELYVTNDVCIGDGVIDGILLYGTNAVGKTSIIKALGISVIMAQSGLYVPCSEFHYYPYDYIFTRIIGNDNIFKGLSTFAVEMSELRTILRLSTKNSLILGDELCSGTENISAISIFVSGIQALHKKNCSFIFATHLHEIVEYDEIKELKNVVLKHMEVFYDKNLDLLVYDRRLKDGSGNSLYGLEVCKSLNLPEEFLNKAYEIRMKYNPEKDSILSLKTSHFNSKKIISLCENCGETIGKEVHHLQYQNNANDNGIIEKDHLVFHKNNLANLMTLCEKCHDDLHKKKKVLKRVKTSNGYKLI